MIHALISARSYQTQHPQPPLHTALFIEQPLSRFMVLIATVFPPQTTIGYAYSDSALFPVSAVVAAAQKRGISVQTTVVSEESEITKRLATLLPTVDLLLLLPDNRLLNRHTARGIILQAYQQKIPLLTYSESLVKAGGGLALFSTVEEQGEEVAEMVATISAGGVVPPPSYPRKFSVAVNYQLVKNIGLELDEEEKLKWAVMQEESR
ncbi:MAG: hypothetical protein HQL48_11655 [Gammaproteobacteria bacterium]|nr:hypothetical protein [Gammaproteobacteria bacterium]